MTREEAWRKAKGYLYDALDGKEADEIINALEQELILDKIRDEITNIPITDTDGHNNNWYREPQAIINDVLQIIDKYRAESEVSE